MKKVYLLSWEVGFLTITFVKDLINSNIYGLMEAKKTVDNLLAGDESIITVHENDMDKLMNILNTHKIKYRIE